uniref:Uncharacterized protein n=1 Tax=viral metagenome TaxID=1070528 RepID=A0A6M3J2X0_9ZZZZ
MENWVEIAAIVIATGWAAFGVTYLFKWQQVSKLLVELGQAFTKTGMALDDRKLSKEESMVLLKEWYDVYKALLPLLPASVLKILSRR